MKHYREVKASDKLPGEEGWFLTNLGEKYFYGNNWYSLPPTSDGTEQKFNYVAGITHWLIQYDPEAEAQERYDRASVALRNSRMGIFPSKEEENALEIASGLK